MLATSPVWAPLWRDVLPAEEVLPTALALARRLAQENSVISMALNKTMIWRCPSTPEETHLLDSKGIFATARGDATEGGCMHLASLLCLFADRARVPNRYCIIHGEAQGKVRRHTRGDGRVRVSASLPPRFAHPTLLMLTTFCFLAASTLGGHAQTSRERRRAV